MWKILYLPAIDEQGEALWPEYFSLEKLLQIKRQMGGPLFAAMYLGRPEALSGEVFKREWFKPCKLLSGQDGLYVQVDGDLLAFEELLIFQAWDLAISQKETADYTVCATLALHPPTMRLMLFDINRARRTFDQTQRSIAQTGEFWKPYVVGIEKIAYQAAAVQEAVRNTLLPIRELKADHDKVTRARLPAALAEAGKLYVAQANWNEVFFDELLEFPNGRHDDQVDALSMATALAQNYVPSSFFLWDGG